MYSESSIHRLIFFWLLLIGLIPSTASAQDSLSINQQLWLEYLYDYDLNHKLNLFGDASYRSVFFNGLENTRRVMFRPSIRWKISDKISVRGGLGTFYTVVNDSTKSLEFRPWQGVAFRWPQLGRLVFSHYVRFEERFTYNLKPWDGAVGFRVRYQLSTRIKFTKSKMSRYFYIPLAAELFFAPKGEVVFDFSRNNSRFTIGLGYIINYRFAVEGRFVMQRSLLGTGQFGTTDQIFRIMLRQTLFPINPEFDEVVQ